MRPFSCLYSDNRIHFIELLGRIVREALAWFFEQWNHPITFSLFSLLVFYSYPQTLLTSILHTEARVTVLKIKQYLSLSCTNPVMASHLTQSISVNSYNGQKGFRQPCLIHAWIHQLLLPTLHHPPATLSSG